MAENVTDVIDSQILAENVSFLDNCFDNSFVLQSTLTAVKEYAAEEGNEPSTSKLQSGISTKKNTTISQNRSVLSDCNRSKIVSQVRKNKVLNKNLSDWGLPQEITRKYEQRGIQEMFDWQVTCLANPKVLMECCNLVYSAPTSAGKTLVAEILTIKTILERQKKVIIILPFVSIVREKMFYLQDILSSSGIRVEGFMGSQSPPGGLQAVHVAICTIEKANSLVNRLLDEGDISSLGAVVVDELHLLGDPHRGYILELLLTKIKYVSSKLDDVQIQIVGMSATLPNLDVLAKWLEAELFITQFRPIPLDEFCLVGNKFYGKTGQLISTFKNGNGSDETDSVLKICLDTIKDSCSVLIFCMTKNRCENLAQTIASSFYKLGCAGNDTSAFLRKELNSERISEVLEQLKNCPVGLDQVIKNAISFGVAYHHAGLTFDERDIIEGGFKSGAIRVLVATSTLSSGVNLPARKVIVRSPVFQRQPINILTYKQMIGRAGRMGKDIKGESILICTEAEKKIGFDLMMGALDPVRSCIESEDKYMRAILEMIASQVACTKEELDLYSMCTLLFTQENPTLSQNSILQDTLHELMNYELVRIQTDGNEMHYTATPLGKACLSSSMAPNDGLSLFCELQKARQCVVLETDLHLIYLVTPYSVSSQWGNIDWLHLLTLWESLTKSMKRVGELVGVQESFIIRCLRGTNKLNNAQNKLNVHKRFYTALALQDLVNEVPLSEVAVKFQCARGFLQSLQQAAATFAGMVTAFCRQLGWKNMEMLVSQFQDRLHFGIHSELIELMKLPSLNGMRARTLFDAGFETVSIIASAEVNAIENALHRSVPFQSDKQREDDDVEDVRKRNKIKSIWITGFSGMTTQEAAKNLILEARKYLQLEIGVKEIKWEEESARNQAIPNNELQPKKESIPLQHSDMYKLPSDIDVKEEPLTRITQHTNVSMRNSIDNSDTEELYFSANVCRTSKGSESALKEKHLTVNNKPLDEQCTNELLIHSLGTGESNHFVCSEIINEITKGKQNEISTALTGTECSPSILKDEVWDTMNFTEAAIEDITKSCKIGNMGSPNISFRESVGKNTVISTFDVTVAAKSNSVKDISLFSSDGDSSSLFEESLPIDLVSSNVFDEVAHASTKLLNQETASDFVSLNNDTIINGFKSTIVDIEDDEDIKLVYEDDVKVTENELGTVISSFEDVEVIETQDVQEISIKDSFRSPFKRHAESSSNCLHHSAKKVRLGRKSNKILIPKKDGLNGPSIKMNLTDSKSFTLELNKCKLKCFILRGDDVCDNFNEIKKIRMAAVSLDVKTSTRTTNEIIGSNIVKQSKSISSNLEKPLVKGIAVYPGNSSCIFMDWSNENTFLQMKSKISSLFINDAMKLKMMSFKTNYIHIRKCFGVDLPSTSIDISLAEWLIDSDEKIPNISYLAKKYIDVDLSTTSIKIDNRAKRFKNLDPIETACVKSWVIWTVAEKQERYLMEKFHNNALNTEIKVSKILADCEYQGLTVDKDLASQLLIDVKNSQETLQKRAYKICGYHFNFNSSKDVAKVLGIYKGRKVSTRKSILESHNSAMSSVVIFWRKLNSILTKTLYPLTEKACIYSEGNKISPSYTMYTSTGRVSMHEPNLQNVPRTFSIPAAYLYDSHPSDHAVEFNCRNIFKASVGYTLVSADYCQLEMRILTHYSEDEVLMTIMRSDEDVFKLIAAAWGNVSEDEVDDDLRQKAKQLCYGILYGMGNKTLAQNLDVSELEAAVFMDTFYKTYPGIRVFTQAVVDECRSKGYVETLMRRRRYLPDINSHVVSKRGTAERQAVNTTIQGSAADIAKAAMCAVEDRTHEDVPRPRLILQMHDELIYEVPQNNKNTFITTLKEVMERTVRLNVPLPVKVRSGDSWGTLKEIQF